MDRQADTRVRHPERQIGKQTEGRQTQTHLTTTSPDDDNESDPAFIRATMSPVCPDDRRRYIEADDRAARWRPMAAQDESWMTWPPPPNACNGAINGALATHWRGSGAFKRDGMPLAHEEFEGVPLGVVGRLRHGWAASTFPRDVDLGFDVKPAELDDGIIRRIITT